MHGPSLATLMVAFTLGSIQPSPASTPDAVAEARRKLADDDGVAAVAILETALPEAGADKDSVLDLLRKAYESAAKQAQAAGRPAEAETYRENLKILTRKSRPAKGPATPAPTRSQDEAPARPSPPAESATPPSIEPTPEAPTPLPEGPIPLPVVDTSIPPAIPASTESPGPVAVVPPSPPVDSTTSEISTADAAFVAKKYLVAGPIYGKLAAAKRLPADRRDQWLYCRAAEVVSRINAQPRTESEWASIKAEVEQIRSLNPSNYLGEYLRDLVAEKQASRKKSKVSKAMVVRGSAPEEPPAADRPARPASNPAACPPKPRPLSKIGTAVGRWQIRDTANFRIYHADPALAAKVAQSAEAARRDQLKRWSKQPQRTGWQPLCEVYLYPTAKQYATMTGQPEDSPGFSTMGMNGGRITARRINLRADHPTIVQAVLPHEITHVILADHFTEKQIPRWADEGLAVLSEPNDEQQRRAADLVTPLAENRLFAVDVLMNMDYPEERYWGLYYAQSVSLTRFLVEQGTPAQMIQFLQESQRDGYEPVLRRVYKIDGFADLQRRWVAYARSKAAENRNVAANPVANGPDLKVR